MKINNLVEAIFAQAVALDQAGGLRNTIYAIGDEVFIMNYDHTVLLRFGLRKSEVSFEHPVSFKANDYDSNVFEEREGKIVFFSEKAGYERKKVCGTSDLTPEEVKALYLEYASSDIHYASTVRLTSDMLELLDDNLSHIEFSAEAGQPLTMIQRNIYSGGIIEIKKANKGLFKEVVKYEFGPLGIKTDDFKAMFEFQSALDFTFPGLEDEMNNFISVRSVDRNVRDMSGFIGACLYDELIQIRAANKVEQPAAPVKSKFTRNT